MPHLWRTALVISHPVDRIFAAYRARIRWCMRQHRSTPRRFLFHTPEKALAQTPQMFKPILQGEKPTPQIGD